jgi:hypothetical protein
MGERHLNRKSTDTRLLGWSQQQLKPHMEGNRKEENHISMKKRGPRQKSTYMNSGRQLLDELSKLTFMNAY